MSALGFRNYLRAGRHSHALCGYLTKEENGARELCARARTHAQMRLRGIVLLVMTPRAVRVTESALISGFYPAYQKRYEPGTGMTHDLPDIDSSILLVCVCVFPH